jgi:hypothetical protein
VGGAQKRPRVGGDQPQVRSAQVEVAARDGGQPPVQLDSVDPRARQEMTVGAGGRAAGVAEDRDAAGRASERGERRREEVVPVPAGEKVPGR